jgi:hypothetical protein
MDRDEGDVALLVHASRIRVIPIPHKPPARPFLMVRLPLLRLTILPVTPAAVGDLSIDRHVVRGEYAGRLERRTERAERFSLVEETTQLLAIIAPVRLRREETETILQVRQILTRRSEEGAAVECERIGVEQGRW